MQEHETSQPSCAGMSRALQWTSLFTVLGPGPIIEETGPPWGSHRDLTWLAQLRDGSEAHRRERLLIRSSVWRIRQHHLVDRDLGRSRRNTDYFDHSAHRQAEQSEPLGSRRDECRDLYAEIANSVFFAAAGAEATTEACLARAPSNIRVDPTLT